MLYAAIDIHKHAFQAAVLDPETGVVVEERFSADRDSLARWAEPWQGPGGGGGDRGDDRLALGLARAGRRRFRGAAGGAGANAGAARPSPQRQDRSPRRALAGAAAGEGDAARVMDPAGADPRAARPDTAAQGAGRGPPPLGSAPARLPAARGLALLALESAQAAGAALGVRAPALRARPPAGRLAAGGDGGAGDAAGHRRRRAASLRPPGRALPGVAVDLRDRPDPRLSPAGRDRRGAALPPRRADHPPGRTRPGRRRIGRDAPPRPPRQGRLTASALGARRSRRARTPHNRPRPRALPGDARAARYVGGETDRRPQDRQAGLPRPARARARHSLTKPEQH